MTIYHGSNSEIRKPDLQHGRKGNDFGQGFYCFESAELAMEAACKLPLDGVANEYELDTDGLNIIDLNSGDYNVLNWMALLLVTGSLPSISHWPSNPGITSLNGLALMYPKPTS